VEEPETAILGSLRAEGGPAGHEPRAGEDKSRKWLIVAIALVTVAIGSAFFAFRYFDSPDRSVNSLAVLPFSNVSGDKDTEFLSDGIAETLINSFTKIPELKVTARTTAFRFRGREDEPKTIGHELGVGAILTGAVLQQGSYISVQVDLIDTADGSQLWGNRYNGKADEIVNIQQRIASDVASRLKLSAQQTEKISRPYTSNADAYQHYLRGRYYWNKRTAEGLKDAIAEFQQAIGSDPSFALAYAGLSDCYLVMEIYAGVPNREVLPKAKAAAEHAIRIDDSLAEAHTSMAAACDADWQWADAQREYERAIELNPNYPTAHHWYGIHLRDIGRFDESVAEAVRAQELDPLSSIINSNLIASYLAKGDLEDAERQGEKTLQLDPDFSAANYTLGSVLLARGRQADALTLLQKAVESSDRNSYALGLLGYGLGVSGKRTEAEAIARELQERQAKGEALGQSVAMVFAGLGDKDAVFDYLDKDYMAHSGYLQQIIWMQPFVALRGDPRFQSLLQHMNIGQNK
jgi:TolB-like protein/Tfp pilus assembly protein PilF